MRFRKTLSFLILAGLVFAPHASAQQKPFTQEQVTSIVRDGFGDDSGAKLIEQRGLALERKGDLRGALEEHRAAYMIDPKDPFIKQNYERVLKRVNQ